MNDKLVVLMLKQFRQQRDEYLKLVTEKNHTKAELGSSAERLTLLQRLLTLDGRSVKLPPVLAADTVPRKRTA